MKKDIDIKNRIVNVYNIDTGKCEDELVKYIDKKMKVRIHSAAFNNEKYIFLGKSSDQVSNSITISSYKKRSGNETTALIIS